MTTPDCAHLIVEGAFSSQPLDRELKSVPYATARVPEYWVVDLTTDTVEVRTEPRLGSYGRVRSCGPDDVIRLVELPDVELRVADFLG